MAEIIKAKREGKNIVITSSIGPDEFSRNTKVNVCISTKEGGSSKPIKERGKNIKTTFKFGSESEAENYIRAHLEDGKGFAIGKTVPIDRKIEMGELLPLLLKSVVLPLVVIIIVYFFFRSYAKTDPMKLLLSEAYFYDTKTVVVRGNISFDKETSDEEEKKLTRKVKVELVFNGKGIKKLSPYKGSFELRFPYQLKPEDTGTYTVRFLRNEKVVKSSDIDVKNKSGYPLVQINRAYVDSDRNVTVRLSCFYAESDKVLIKLCPVFSSSIGNSVAKKFISLKDSKMLTLGPVSIYSPLYAVIIERQGRVIARKDIPCDIACAKLESAYFLSMSTIQIRGFWDGPKGVTVMADLLENGKLIDKMYIEKKFHKRFYISRIKAKKEYRVRLRDNTHEILTKTVILSRSIRNYLKAFSSLLDTTVQFDKAIARIKEGDLKQGIESLNELVSEISSFISTTRTMYAREKSKKVQREIEKIKRYYLALKNISKKVIAEARYTQKNKRKQFLIVLVKKKYKYFSSQITLMNNILDEFIPKYKETNRFQVFNTYIKKEKEEIRKKQFVRHIQFAKKSKRYKLAATICSQAIKEFPSVWQFLLIRYDLYLKLHKENPYIQYGNTLKGFKTLAKKDRKDLIIKLRQLFTRYRLEDQHAKAYVIGSQLLHLKPDLITIKEKLDTIKKTLPLEKQVEANMKLMQFYLVE